MLNPVYIHVKCQYYLIKGKSGHGQIVDFEEKKNHDRIEFMLKVADLRPPYVTEWLWYLGSVTDFCLAVAIT